ncbi:hypothetical protein H920_01023 [Fukomys damarensis]|uniref:Uncharacterized protein n=1 Tax=Fukomys damarensis TaxID=885580 RepID=A0A091E491_FUKDA|nr:hypothetical protein H920_01023 [Fukomys damarensis]
MDPQLPAAARALSLELEAGRRAAAQDDSCVGRSVAASVNCSPTLTSPMYQHEQGRSTALTVSTREQVLAHSRAEEGTAENVPPLSEGDTAEATERPGLVYLDAAPVNQCLPPRRPSPSSHSTPDRAGLCPANALLF